MQSTGEGSVVMGWGSTDNTADTGGLMEATGYGSMLFGAGWSSQDAGNQPPAFTMQSTGTGSFLGGECYSVSSGGSTACNMQSTGSASFLWAYTAQGNSSSTGTASVAMGQNIKATANNAFTFGKDISNGNASSMMIGWTTPSMFINSSKIDIYKQVNVKSNLNMTTTNITDVAQLKFNVITLPTCASAYNGTMARNSTKLYYCDGAIWNALY
jgi:hypothetical protein